MKCGTWDFGERVLDVVRELPAFGAIAWKLEPAGRADADRGQGLTRPVALATATGVLFGLTAALIKLVVQQLDHGWAEPLRHWPLYLALVVAPSGLALSRQAMRSSRLLAPVNAIISSVDPLTAVAIVMLALGERVNRADRCARPVCGGVAAVRRGGHGDPPRFDAAPGPPRGPHRRRARSLGGESGGSRLWRADHRFAPILSLMRREEKFVESRGHAETGAWRGDMDHADALR